MLRLIFLFYVMSSVLQAFALDAAEQPARLQLQVNGEKKTEVRVMFRGDEVLVRLVDLEAYALASIAAQPEIIRGEKFISLKTLSPAVKYVVGQEDLSLRVTVATIASTASAEASPSSKNRSEIKGNESAASTHSTGMSSFSRTELRALLGLEIDRVKKQAVSVIIRGDDILIREADLNAAGFSQSAGRSELHKGEKYISLKSIAPRLKFILEEKDLVLRLITEASSVASSKADSRDQETLGFNPKAEKWKPEQPKSNLPGEGSSAATSDQAAILDLRVNKIRKKEIPVVLRGDDILAVVKDVEETGLVFVGGQHENIGGETYVSLKSLADALTFEMNERDLSLELTVKPAAFGLNVIDPSRDRPANIEYRQDPSGFLNYSVAVQNFRKVGTFSEAGFSIKGNLLYSGIQHSQQNGIVRGLSSFTIDNQKNLNRATLGDNFASSDILGGALTLGGLSFTRDFSLDPYFIRNPGLNYTGAVSTPSTADIYVNGRFQRRVTLPPGQFELRNIPLPTGDANTRVVIRDAFGREQEITSPYYFTAGLLREGLHEYSYNLGAPRNEIDTASFNYGPLVFLGYHRYGFSDGLTTGIRFEATRALVSGGPTISFLLPIGEMEVTTALSRDQGLLGGAAFLGYQYHGPNLTFGSSLKFSTAHYANTSLPASKSRPWLAMNLRSALPLFTGTSLSLGYQMERSRDSGSTHRISLATTRSLFDGLYLFLQAGYANQDKVGSGDLAAGLSYSFGGVNGMLLYERSTDGDSGTVSVNKGLPTGTGYGYRLESSIGHEEFRSNNLVQFQGPWGRYEAEYRRGLGQDLTNFNMAGGFALIGGSILPTRPVQRSFALLQLPDMPNVRGYLNNLEVGRTDSNGQLLIPNLLPYYANKLSISDKDIPLNYYPAVVQKNIAAPFRGGGIATFPLRKIQRAEGAAILEMAGKSITPSFGEIKITADDKLFDSPIGRNGEFYLENIPSGVHSAVIEHEGKTCQFTLTIPNSDDSVIELGRLGCKLP